MSLGEILALLNIVDQFSLEVEEISKEMKKTVSKQIKKIQNNIYNIKMLICEDDELPSDYPSSDYSRIEKMFTFDTSQDYIFEIMPYWAFIDDETDDDSNDSDSEDESDTSEESIKVYIDSYNAQVRLYFFLQSLPVHKLNSIKKINLYLSNASWFDHEKFCNWMESMGSKIVQLTIDSTDADMSLYQVLSYCPNLNDLCLHRGWLKPADEPNDVILLENSPSERIKSKIQHLSIGLDTNEGITQLVPLLRNLKSFELNSYICHDVLTECQRNYPTTFKNFFVFLEKLCFKGVTDIVTNILSICKFPHVTQLRVGVTTDELPYLYKLMRMVSSTLVKSKIVIRCGDVIKDPASFTLPPMPKVIWAEFEYSFRTSATIESASGRNIKDNVEASDPTQIFFSYAQIMHAMPLLKSLKVAACEENVPEKDVVYNFQCWSTDCTHIQQFLAPKKDLDEPIQRSPLEELSLACCFKYADLVQFQELLPTFINLQKLNIWIHCTQLKPYFEAFSYIRTLESLTIFLSLDINDFGSAIQSYLWKFTSLKELVFKQQLKYVGDPTTFIDFDLNGVIEALSEFTIPTSLEILSFIGMDIEEEDAEKLKIKLQEVKPNLKLVIV